VAEEFQNKGYKNVKVLAGGYDAWEKADPPAN
jgi:rhodanese-related sulfurtransferase